MAPFVNSIEQNEIYINFYAQLRIPLNNLNKLLKFINSRSSPMIYKTLREQNLIITSNKFTRHFNKLLEKVRVCVHNASNSK